jgi:hypothetical protein
MFISVSCSAKERLPSLMLQCVGRQPSGVDVAEQRLANAG